MSKDPSLDELWAKAKPLTEAELNEMLSRSRSAELQLEVRLGWVLTALGFSNQASVTAAEFSFTGHSIMLTIADSNAEEIAAAKAKIYRDTFADDN